MRVSGGFGMGIMGRNIRFSWGWGRWGGGQREMLDWRKRDASGEAHNGALTEMGEDRSCTNV
jgi:hypothetical protein